MMIINSPKLHIWPFVVCQWPFAGIPPCVNCLRVRGDDILGQKHWLFSGKSHYNNIIIINRHAAFIKNLCKLLLTLLFILFWKGFSLMWEVAIFCRGSRGSWDCFLPWRASDLKDGMCREPGLPLTLWSLRRYRVSFQFRCWKCGGEVRAALESQMLIHWRPHSCLRCQHSPAGAEASCVFLAVGMRSERWAAGCLWL